MFWVAHASRVSGFGVAPKRTFFYFVIPNHQDAGVKFATARTRSPARETRALPNRLGHARPQFGIELGFRSVCQNVSICIVGAQHREHS
jgi:hypothetical protein